MKVKDLIKELSKLDENLDILCYTEDEELVPSEDLFRILAIDSVDTTVAEKTRLEDGTPSLKFGESELSQKHATINVTSTF